MINTEKLYEELIKLKNFCNEDEQKYIEQAISRNERAGEAVAL